MDFQSITKNKKLEQGWIAAALSGAQPKAGNISGLCDFLELERERVPAAHSH